LLGGPFEGLAIVDEGTASVLYIEGSHQPRIDQREIKRELETILFSFKTAKKSQKSP